MKYITIVFIGLLFSSTAYWYGFQVGLQEGTLIAHGDAANSEVSAIEEIQFNPEVDPRDLHEIRLNKHIVVYGEYLENKVPSFSLLGSKKEVINHMFSSSIKYRKNNPRIKNGVAYSPLAQSIDQLKSNEEIPTHLKTEFILESRYYNRALNEE